MEEESVEPYFYRIFREYPFQEMIINKAATWRIVYTTHNLMLAAVEGDGVGNVG